MNTYDHNSTRRSSAGFTLPEVMIATFIFGSVMAAILGVYVVAQVEWKDTTLAIDTTHNASIAMERIIHGYGLNLGLRSGFEKNYTYDTRFALDPPPEYPPLSHELVFGAWKDK